MAEKCIICNNMANNGLYCKHKKHKGEFICHKCCDGTSEKSKGKCKFYDGRLCNCEVENGTI